MRVLRSGAKSALASTEVSGVEALAAQSWDVDVLSEQAAAEILQEQDDMTEGAVSLEDEQRAGEQDNDDNDEKGLGTSRTDLTQAQWEHGWTEWSNKRRRARMAQFIVQHLHNSSNARWIDIKTGKFELNSWPAIAREWYTEKVRGSEPSNATSILEIGLPAAFPDILEVKKEAVKKGTQYLKRVFVASKDTMISVEKLALSPEQDSTSSSGRKRKSSVPQDVPITKEPGSLTGSPMNTTFCGQAKKTKRPEQTRNQLTPNALTKNPSTGTVFRLKRISIMAAKLRQERDAREKLHKKYENAISAIDKVTTVSKAGSALIGLGGIIFIATGVGAPAGVALEGIAAASGALSYVAPLVKPRLIKKARKHESIAQTAATILATIDAITSRARNDGHISYREFQRVIHQMQRFNKLKRKIQEEAKKPFKKPSWTSSSLLHGFW